MREFAQGMGQAVAERTVLRKVFDGIDVHVSRKLVLNPSEPSFRLWCEVADASGRDIESDKNARIIGRDPVWRYETWGDVAERVAIGNTMLHGDSYNYLETQGLFNAISDGKILMSGRHLQQGDSRQPSRNGEVYINCSTSPVSWALKMLLLNGTGVGRCYDDDMMVVDWDRAPRVRCLLSKNHADFKGGFHFATEIYADKKTDEHCYWHDVEDSREGWAKAVEYWETLAYNGDSLGKMLYLCFDNVREKGSPIMGMQGRPSSGPVPFMNALMQINTIIGAGWPKWKQAMFVDHFLAACVAMGGARRAARMSTKYWKDPGIFEFIKIKQKHGLWSSNNTVLVDEEFWSDLETGRYLATKVFNAITKASFEDGEPGLLNAHKLKNVDEGINSLDEEWFGYHKYRMHKKTKPMMRRILDSLKGKSNRMIVNPCGEIPLSILGGYCVLVCIAPYHCDDLSDAIETARKAARAAVRVNLMDTLAKREVERTNRIGIGITGVLEFAWKFQNATFRELLDELHPFWAIIETISQAAQEEAKRYSKELGLVEPHTIMTIPPAGTIAKLFGLGEGWHLPSMKRYLRNVQFLNSDPLIEIYKSKGYPTKKLFSYEGNTIVGFPTETELSKIMPNDMIVTASEATPEEQFKWLQLGEKYWLGASHGGQISYTLKYDPNKISLYEYRDMVKKYMPTIKACSIMPQADTTSYEYLPEQPVTEEEWVEITSLIGDTQAITEDISMEHLTCEGGACPIDFKEVK